jgi:hypothetical protein
MSSPERESLLEAWAIDAGRKWAAALRRELAEEGRPVAGGWPGTLSEARSRAAARCKLELAALAHATASSGELDQAARRLNAAARRDWLAKAEREVVEES